MPRRSTEQDPGPVPAGTTADTGADHDAGAGPGPGPDAPGVARAYDAWFDSPWGRHAWGEESRLVRAALDGAPGRRVLDVGCGTGRSSALARRPGGRVVGIDPDPGMLALARARVDAAILARGERLPFADAAFDTSVAVTVLEFVPEPADVLAEMARVTRRPGRIVVGALNPRSPWGVWGRRELRTGPWREARFLSGDDLVRLGRPHGRVSMDEGLHAPGALPGLDRWGPVAERLSRRLRIPGAFRVLTIDRR